MGGYGALINSLKYADMFSGCGAFSAPVRTDTQMGERYIRDDRSASELYGPMEGDALPDHWYENLHHASSGSVVALNSVGYWIDCGNDDFLTIGNASLHIEFEKRGVAHEYRVRDGAHNWTYWRTGLTDALRFISDGFRQK